MGAQLPTIVAIQFGIGDGAAAPSTAVSLIPAGIPDLVDLTAGEVLVPANGFIVGISVQTPLSSGDTFIVAPTIGGTRQTALTATATNAAPAASAQSTAGIAVTAGQTIGIKYLTTTTGTYTAHDVLAVLYFAYVPSFSNLVVE